MSPTVSENRPRANTPEAGQTAHDWERQVRALFASERSDPAYQVRQAPLYEQWREYNREYFGGRLKDVHIDFGRTAHRSLCHCERLTGYGGQLLFVLNAGLVFGTRADWVGNPWPQGHPSGPPAGGTRRMIDDLLLRLTVRQHVIEIDEPAARADDGYDGFGRMFAAHANRIGATLGLAQVVARNRADRESQPLAKFWPHCVHERDYYGDDVTQDLVDLAAGTTRAGRRPGGSAAPGLGLLELLQFLLKSNNVARAVEIIDRQVDWLRRARERRVLVENLMIERGELDVDGETPLGIVGFDPDWRAWNSGTVLHIAEAADRQRDFFVLPILADALEDAGCHDGRILRHLRANIGHTRDCWVLRRLIDTSYWP